MAQDIGLLLRGLGASFSNQVPQFRQELAQQQQMERQQREDEYTRQQRARQAQMQDIQMMRDFETASFQDALTLTRMLSPEVMNVEGALNFLEDRREQISGLEKMGLAIRNDPTEMLYNNLRRYAGSGDAAALSSVRNLAGAYTAMGVGRGVIKLPEAQEPVKGVAVGGRLVNPVTGAVMFEPTAEGAAAPSPQSPQGKLQQDITAGIIPLELGQQLIAAEQAAAGQAVAKGQQEVATAAERVSMQNNEVSRAYELANRLATDPNIGAIFGTVSSKLPTFKAASADAEVALEELKNLLTMGNLNRMTGVLSESDIRLIASAASGLDLKMSDQAAARKLKEISDRLFLRMQEKGIPIPQLESRTEQTATPTTPGIIDWFSL